MELFFRVTTTPDIDLAPRQYRDGDIVQLAPDGVLFSGADILAWFQSDTIPPGWALIPNWNQRAIRRALLRVKWLSTHAAGEIATEWGLSEAVAIEMQEEAVSDRAEYLDEGIDSNWGRLDLRSGGVVRVDAITPNRVRELIDGDETETHRPTLRGKRRWRVDYRSHLSAGIIASLEENGTRVEAQRATSLPFAAILDDPRT